MDKDVQGRSPRARGLTERAVRALAAGFALALLSATLTGAPAAAAPVLCTSGVTGDVNGDGQAEVAVGEPGNASGAGAVHLFYGTPDGIVADPTGTALNDQYLSQDTPGVPGTAEADDTFGWSTASGDFNGDGCADLAVGAPGENNGRGAVTVLYGSPSGLTGTGSRTWTENGLLGPESALAGESFGEVLAAGDLDNDAVADLVVGAPTEEVGDGRAGAAVMILGSPTGLAGEPGTTVLLSQATPGVPGVPEDGDGFGAALAIGDFNGNSVGDLAVGVPGENDITGLVEILPGRTGTGVGSLPATAISQNTPGVRGASETLDRFGAALAAGDATNDSFDDLAVGAPGEDASDPEPGFGAGAVTFLRGSASGVTATGNQRWTQNSPGVDGVAGSADQFGFSLVMGHLDNGPTADLAIGTPGDAVGRVAEAGSVTLLLGQPSGLSTVEAGGSRFHQDVPDLSGAAEPGDLFGWSVAAVAVQTPDQDSLVIGVPGESAGSSRDGLVHQLATLEFGPITPGSRTLHLNSPGVQGRPQGDDGLGFAVG
jgi:hypothetical protein